MYKTRNDFGKLFQEHFQKGFGAEIGVQNGFNSKQIWKYWKGGIFLVDWWDKPEELRQCMINNIHKHYQVLVGDSIKMAECVEGRSLDWIYIDAGHTYAEVKADFEAWFSKVRKGGIVSGHDYGDNDCIGVKEFIDEYMKLNPDVQINFTTEDFWEGKEYQSWWFVKE